KLNESELEQCCQLLQIAGCTQADLDTLAGLLRERYEIDTLAVTRGVDGTVLYNADGSARGEVPSVPADAGADSVGAGDACCAGLVAGLVAKLSIQETVELANRAGAFVAARKGATPLLPPEIVSL